MASSNVSRGVELRRRLREANPDDILYLNEIGQEFLGPFVVDKPLTLVGNGRTTQLFAQGAPALIVRSDRVRLQHLDIQDSYNIKSGIGLLHIAGSAPAMEDVKIYGQVAIMTVQQLIDLGDVYSDQRAETYLELSVPGPATLLSDASSAKWLNISPVFLPAAGKHLLTFSCSPGKTSTETIAIGNFAISTSGGNQTIWVSARMLTAELAPGSTPPITLLLPPNKLRIRFADRYDIGSGSFPGHPNANKIADRQAIITREPSGLYVLLQPWDNPVSTVVNGKRMGNGDRIVLKADDVIDVAGLQLKVEVNPAAQLISSDKMKLDLGTTAGRVQSTSFALSYSGAAKEKLKLVPTVPWLQVAPTEIEMKKGATAPVQVTYSPAPAGQPQARRVERGAVLVIGKTEALWLNAQIQIEPASVIPTASGTLEFKNVVDWTTAKALVMVSNSGTQDWRANVTTAEKWLVPNSNALVVPAGKSATIGVGLNQNVESLPSPSDQTGKLTLSGDNVTLEIGVTLRLQFPQVDPSVEMGDLDFGEVDDLSGASPKTIILVNKGGKDWNATARANVPWLDPPTMALKVPAGGRKSVVLAVSKDLPVGLRDVPDAFVISGDGKEIRIRARAGLKQLKLKPNAVQFGKVSDWRTAPERKVELENRGDKAWLGRITCPPWVTSSPPMRQHDWVCPPKDKLIFTFRLNDQIKEGVSKSSIAFDGSEKFGVACGVQYAPQAEIRVDKVDFGIVSGSSAPSRKFKVSNVGTKDWSAQIRATASATPLLAVAPQLIHVPQKGSAQFELVLREGVDRLPAGVHKLTRALVFDGDGRGSPIDVSFELPAFDLRAEPGELSYEFVRDADLTGLEQEVRVVNSGGRTWRGQISSVMSWLVVEPREAVMRPNEDLVVKVRLTDAAGTFGTGEHAFGNVVLFDGANLKLGLRMTIRNSPAAPTLDITPSDVDFGALIDGGPLPSRSLTVRAEGDWLAEATGGEDWFEVTPKKIGNTDNRAATLTLRTTPKAQSLNLGTTWGTFELSLVGGAPTKVQVRIERVEPEPMLELRPNSLGFDWHVGDSLPSSPIKVRVSNPTSVARDISVDSPEPWLAVSPPSARCAAAGLVEFEIGLTAYVNSLRDGTHKSQVAFRVGRREFAFPVSLTVDRATYDWSVDEPQFISFGAVSGAEWSGRGAESIVIRNRGTKPLALLISVDKKGGTWLAAPASLRVEPGTSRLLQVALRKDGQPQGLGELTAVLGLAGAGPLRQIPVSVRFIRDNRPPPSPPVPPVPKPGKLVVEPSTLAFKVNDGDDWSKVAPAIIRLSNPLGQADWKGRVRAKVSWLRIASTFEEVSLGPGESIELKVWLKRPLFGGVSGDPQSAAYDEAVALSIVNRENDDATSIRARVEAPSQGEIVSPQAIDRVRPTSRSVLPDSIDFGDVPVDGWDRVAPLPITINNDSDTAFIAHIGVHATWLGTPKSDVVCLPRQSSTFQVQLKAPVQVMERIRRGVRIDNQGVIVTINHQSFAISVRARMT